MLNMNRWSSVQIFSLTIFMIIRFFFPSSSSVERFIIDWSLSSFPPQFLTGLRAFSLVTWLFETYQLPYGARMFSMVSRFSFPASFIRWGFSPSPHFTSTILRSMELASKEEDNYNDMTSGEFLKRKSRVESSQSGSHVTTIIQNFTLVSLTFSMILHPIGLPFEAVVPSLSTHSSLYALVSLCTPLTIMSIYQPEKYSA